MTYSGSFANVTTRTIGLVLIADPFVGKVASLSARLELKGCRVVTAPTLGSAIEQCQQNKPDYLLTELKFPDGRGLDLIRHVSDEVPDAKIIVHTWFADIRITLAAIKAGADDFVPKPTDEGFLIDTLLYGAANIPYDCEIKKPNHVRQEHIEQVMRFNKSNVSEAARSLRLDRRSLQRMLKRYNAPASAEQS